MSRAKGVREESPDQRVETAVDADVALLALLLHLSHLGEQHTRLSNNVATYTKLLIKSDKEYASITISSGTGLHPEAHVRVVLLELGESIVYHFHGKWNIA